MNIFIDHDRTIKPYSIGSMLFRAMKDMGYSVHQVGEVNETWANIYITVDPVFPKYKNPDTYYVHWEIDPVRRTKPENYFADLMFVADREISSDYKDAIFLPPAVDPDIFKRKDPPTHDLSFVGSYGSGTYDYAYPGYTDKGRLLDLAEENGFKVYKDYNAYGDRYVAGLGKGRFILNRPGLTDLNLRFFETMALGCMLYYPVKDVSDLAVAGVHYVPFTNDDEFLEALVMPEKKRKVIEYEARMNILKNHTYENRVKTMMSYLT